MALTAKEQKFIEEYLKSGNRTQAVINAGYKAANRQRASEIGYQLLQKTPVFEAIQVRLQESAMSANEVLMRLAAHARGDLAEFAGVEDLSGLKDHPRSFLIKKLKKTVTRFPKGDEVVHTEIEIHDPQSALLNLGKNHGLFTDKHIVTVKVEKELEEFLNLLERKLDTETYERILAIASGEQAGPEEIGAAEADPEPETGIE